MLNLADSQIALAQAVRQQNASFLGENTDRHRINIYARLVRNNTFSFIDRCYVETQKHISPSDWLHLKERFVCEGKSNSPYFQDIAEQFLQFCRKKSAVSATILELMDFEQAQLLAEVAIADVPQEFEWDNNVIMQLSSATQLRQYSVNFISSHFNVLEKMPVYVIIWRNSNFDVIYQRVDELDFLLFNLLSDNPLSFNSIATKLNEIGYNSLKLLQVLQQRWQTWIEQDVIYPFK